MAFLIGGANSAAADDAYDVANSCRFNDGDDPYLSRTSPNSSPTLETKGTFAFWCKRAAFTGANQYIFSSLQGGVDGQCDVFFNSSNALHIQITDSSIKCKLVTDRLFRDPSAWYHVIFSYDSTPSTPSASSVRLWINGVLETSFSTETYPSQSDPIEIFQQNHSQIIASDVSAPSAIFDGYLSEVIGVDGQALVNTDFGEFDSDSPTIWKPIDISEINVGTLGFYCDFEASGTLGNDVSDVGDFTANNLAATDQSLDSPTNNFPTMNSLYGQIASAYRPASEEGNLQSTSSTTQWKTSIATMGVTAGKWYMEVKVISVAGGGLINIGFTDLYHPNSWGATSFNNYVGFGALQIGYYNDGGATYTGDSATSYGDGYAANDILSVALNVDDEEVIFYKNGTAQASGAAIDLPTSSSSTGTWLFMQSTYNAVISMNYGSPVYANSSDAADANGYGAFEYAPPDGFLALCTKNLGSDGG